MPGTPVHGEDCENAGGEQYSSMWPTITADLLENWGGQQGQAK